MDSNDHAITDEMLSAWLDSALDEADSRRVEQALEEDPRLNRRLARMMRNDRRLRRHFQSEVARPVPQDIAAMLEPASEPTAPGSISVFERLRNWVAPSSPLQLASALAVVAAVGVGVVVMTDGTGPGDAPQPDATLAWATPSTDAALQDFLDSQPSGRPEVVGDDMRGIVDLSFEHADGRYCRQYRVALSERRGGVAGIACRTDSGWQAELVQRVDAPVGGTDMFHAAGGQVASAVDYYIVDNMAGDVLVGDSELEVIERNWRQP